MTVAILGVLVMQVYYIQESFKLKSAIFDQNVNAALTAVANKVQRNAALQHLNEKDTEIKKNRDSELKAHMDSILAVKLAYKEKENARKLRQRQQIIDYLSYQDSAVKASFHSAMVVTEEQYKKYSNPRIKNTDFGLEIQDEWDITTGSLIKRSIKPRLPEIQQSRGGQVPDSIRYIAFSTVDGMPRLISYPTYDPELIEKFKKEDQKAEKEYQQTLNKLYADTQRIYYVNRLEIIQDVASEMDDPNLPLKKRLPNKLYLDTLIRAELNQKNIPIDYNFWVSSMHNQKQIVFQNVQFKPEEREKEQIYSHILFGNDLLRDPGVLYISFPDKNSLLMGSLLATFGSSAALLLVLVFIFAYTIGTILKQKKLSEMKSDFINNMTHEFKTPVATIMIASEALKEEDVAKDENRVKRLAGIIYDENARLGNHIERVLDVARVGTKEIELDLAEISLNELISAVVDSMDLQLKKRDSKVVLNLNAKPDLLLADELHLSNVIYNLIDNAIKYSKDRPIITISTQTYAKHMVFSIKDEGIGLSKDQTKRIFDQFYRVPTGNLHDVKGFGLGLNYVQEVVQKMGAQIKVNSEKDKGTQFDLIFPIK